MTTPQNNVKSVSVLELEDFVINLERAEHLLNVYFEFIDEECPNVTAGDTFNDNDFEKMSLDAVGYACRTDMFRAVLYSCFDLVRRSKAELSRLIYPPQTA